MRIGLTATEFPFVNELTELARGELTALPAHRVPPGQTLLTRGEPVAGAYLVMAGSLRVYCVTAEGREATLYHVQTGQTCVLALASALQRESFPAWAESWREGATFVAVPGDVLQRLFHQEPAFRDYLVRALSGRVFDLMRTLEETGSAQLEERVARYLLRRMGPDGCVHASQAQIALELGTAREVVFRVLRSFAARALIDKARLRIRVLNVPGLRRIAREDAAPAPDV